jgi:hypothetical protein
MGRKQGFFESDSSYLVRMRQEADEGRIERESGEAPSQGFFEADADYRHRISREADEDTVSNSTGSEPSQGFLESDRDYARRVEQEANERVIEDVVGSGPSQGFFESDDSYRSRIDREADEAVIERATGTRPTQGFFESDETYIERISTEADEHNSDDKSSSGCFLTTACTSAGGLGDDCEELSVLRRFRDEYLATSQHGRALLEQYYRQAPGIVRTIDASAAARDVYAEVLASVRTVVKLIENKRGPEAVKVYAGLFRTLSSRFGSAGEPNQGRGIALHCAPREQSTSSLETDRP